MDRNNICIWSDARVTMSKSDQSSHRESPLSRDVLTKGQLHDYSFEVLYALLGTVNPLSYNELKIVIEKDHRISENWALRLNFVQSFNDEYIRKGKLPSDNDYNFFKSNILEILTHFEWPDEDIAVLLKAELYREIGEFENALRCLEERPMMPDDFILDYRLKVKRKILERKQSAFKVLELSVPGMQL